MARGDNSGRQNNEDLSLLCSWQHWAVSSELTWHCPYHSTATLPSSFWDSLRKFPHHRVRGKSTPVELQGTGEPNHHHTHPALQLGAWLPPAPEWAETSCVPPTQAPMPSQRRKQCVLRVCTVSFSRRQSTIGKSTAQPPASPGPLNGPFPRC